MIIPSSPSITLTKGVDTILSLLNEASLLLQRLAVVESSLVVVAHLEGLACRQTHSPLLWQPPFAAQPQAASLSLEVNLAALCFLNNNRASADEAGNDSEKNSRG